VKQTLKRLAPPSAWTAARNTLDAVKRLPEIPEAYFSAWRRDSIRQLRQCQDIHAGKRCFIIGNGPSLRQTDLAKLRREHTFGLNRIYLLFPELGFQTTYFVSINDLVLEQCAAEIQALPMPKFLTWRARRFFTAGPGTSFLYTTYTGPGFSRRATGRLWEGATVTYVALQLAFHMGFEQVILVGVDHNFSSRGQANQTVTSEGDDPNHFAPNYFGKGFRWQLPDLDTSEKAYRLAKQAYEKAGRQVLDATVGGKLTVFPRVEYSSLF
jgi:hypothetical protein